METKKGIIFLLFPPLSFPVGSVSVCLDKTYPVQPLTTI